MTTGNDMSYRPRGLWSTSPENRTVAAYVEMSLHLLNKTYKPKIVTTHLDTSLKKCIIHNTHTNTSTITDTVLSVAKAHSAHQSVRWLLYSDNEDSVLLSALFSSRSLCCWDNASFYAQSLASNTWSLNLCCLSGSVEWGVRAVGGREGEINVNETGERKGRVLGGSCEEGQAFVWSMEGIGQARVTGDWCTAVRWHIPFPRQP